MKQDKQTNGDSCDDTNQAKRDSFSFDDIENSIEALNERLKQYIQPENFKKGLKKLYEKQKSQEVKSVEITKHEVQAEKPSVPKFELTKFQQNNPVEHMKWPNYGNQFLPR